MAFNVTNFDRQSLIDIGKSTIENSSVAGKLGIQGNDSNLRQFYNRMGSNATYFADKSIYKLVKKHYFDIEFDFKPKTSTVETILKRSLAESTSESLKFLVQSIEVPDILNYGGINRVMSELGTASLAGVTTVASDEQFTINFLSTEFSVHEHALYYWLRETTSSEWEYDERPFSKCDMTIYLLDHKTGERVFGYKLYNAYPSKIETVNISHELDSGMTRSVMFQFEVMSVLPSTKIKSNVLDDAFDKYIGSKIGGKVNKLSSGVTDKFGDKLNF